MFAQWTQKVGGRLPLCPTGSTANAPTLIITKQHKNTKYMKPQKKLTECKQATVATFKTCNKCSAVAEMDDRFATIDMARNVGGCAHFYGGGSWVLI